MSSSDTYDGVVDSATWTDGDFALISADSVRFRVPSYHLMSASAVLRDMILACTGPPELFLVDPDIERARVVDLFLSLITTATLAPFSSPLAPTPASASTAASTSVNHNPLPVLLALLSLLDKYDCPAAHTTLRLCIPKLPLSPLDKFTVGAVTNDTELCAAALIPPTFPGTRIGGTVAAHTALHPRNMSLEEYGRIPQRYTWALGRAWEELDYAAGVKAGRVAARFAEVLAEPEKKRKAALAASAPAVRRSTRQRKLAYWE